ncbi:MAG: tail sheath stabilizer and completion protein [Candidatus Thorarchaeota archaeon]|jgi:hypothetical protein
MNDIINPGNHPIKGLNECNDISPLQESMNTEGPSLECGPDELCNPEVPRRPDMGWLEKASNKKTGIGEQGLCDPQQTGQIINDLRNPNRNVAYRYSKAIRGADEAMLGMFNNVVVIDEDGKSWPVPIIWATQERAVQTILGDNIRKDDSTVVDRIRLPMLAIYANDIQFDQTRYTYHKAIDYMRSHRPDGKPGFTVDEEGKPRSTVFGVSRGIPVNIGFTLYAWTLYMEDMDQILEQVLPKFSPVAYIRVRGVSWETIVTLDSVANNLDVEPGDKKLRVIKYQFNMTAQSYIPQPLVRKKAVLKTKIDMWQTNKEAGIDLDNATNVLARLEEAVRELE